MHCEYTRYVYNIIEATNLIIVYTFTSLMAYDGLDGGGGGCGKITDP